MSIIKYVTLQKIVAHDFRYEPRTCVIIYVSSVLEEYRVEQETGRRFWCKVAWWAYRRVPRESTAFYLTGDNIRNWT